MSRLKDARALLEDELRAALEDTPLGVFGTVPEALEPPCVVIQAADPFLTPGDTFAGEWSAHYDLILCLELLSNAQATEDLEDHLPGLLEALAGTEYGVDAVGRPGPVHTAEWVAHAITVSVSRFLIL